MRVRLVPRAQADMDAAIAWWRECADYPLLLETALKEALDRLAVRPFEGALAGSRRVPDARRLILKTRHLLFYRVDEAAGEVVVLRLWHTSRHRKPKIQSDSRRPATEPQPCRRSPRAGRTT